MSSSTGPQAWLAEDVRLDNSWILRLTSEEANGFRNALVHARKVNKPLLEMEQADYPLTDASRKALERAIATTQGRWGMCLVKGFPTDEWTEEDMRLAYWGMGLYMGVGRTQNRASEVISDVRDTGSSYKVKGGRGYNTSAGLDFHQDSCDVVALLCRRTAKSGGTSKVMSSIALRDRVQKLRPDLIPVLQDPNWFHSYQNAQDPSQPPYYRCPIFGNDSKVFCARTNRKNTIAAQNDFPEVPRLTPKQQEALHLLDEIMPSDEFCYSMELERGDMQLLNSLVTLHSRTPFEDFEYPDAKRHLMRLWMSIPTSQPLPAAWAEYWGDVRAGAVRGGVRGSSITPEFLAYEERHAETMGMPFTPWKPLIAREDMAKIMAAH
ncbi:hypothetical protein D9758_014590 [Tetrapyrgos nigripes]|uniref:TauD/TfdA-like domain-containing protein n=1 Tax=Tetrapyrgos nigripes TaxID=182062 RepID=A0A8H5C112_9AGAR|nr:hypothetical protein D9758_014590 [Tetrapyrgos nigripes]